MGDIGRTQIRDVVNIHCVRERSEDSSSVGAAHVVGVRFSSRYRRRLVGDGALQSVRPTMPGGAVASSLTSQWCAPMAAALSPFDSAFIMHSVSSISASAVAVGDVQQRRARSRYAHRETKTRLR